MQDFQELTEETLCPCGSGKPYGECCKKKSLRFGMQDGKLIKQVKVMDEVSKELERIQEMFEDYYGRKPGEEDYVLAFTPIYNDRVLTQTVYAMQEIGIPEDKIYAYYKTDGLIPVEGKLDLISERDLQEFEERCREYREKMEEAISDHVNSLHYVVYTNAFLEDKLGYIMDALMACLNDFIRRHSREQIIRDFKMETEQDYCLFSAVKTIKTLESIIRLKENNLPECIYALGRGIYENYMYLCAINGDREFFEKRLLPRVDEENYTFDTYPDGHINYRRIIHKQTKHRLEEVKTSELRKRLLCEEDRELYHFFYATACQYVHVDVLSAKTYFGVSDPYDEVKPALIAELIIVVLAVLLLDQLRSNGSVKVQFQKDAEHLCKKLAGMLDMCLKLTLTDTEHSNAVLELLRKRLGRIELTE